MPEQPFDSPQRYDQMLSRGISLSGETRDYFAEGRVAEVVRRLPRGFLPRRILDYGCGTGDTCRLLAAAFPGSTVVGADTSADAVAWAAAHRAGTASFTLVTELANEAPFDLCYLNGVLHHVPRGDQRGVIESIRDRLSDGGFIAVFDNNPFNPGARLVMRRIPFDRDALMLTASRVSRLLRAAGFSTPLPTRYLFVFPRPLALLRFAEPWLSRLPLGAQYCVAGRRAGEPRDAGLRRF
jgi:SAM-dependent methyltransferase